MRRLLAAKDIQRMIPAPNVVKVAMKYSFYGLSLYNIFNVLCPSPATSGNLVTIAGVFQAWWNSPYRDTISAQTQWLSADLTALDSSGSPTLTYINTGTLAGGIPGNAYSPNVTICISFRTGLSGRSYRGRTYMPGLSDGFTTYGGRITTAAVAFIQPKYDNLRTSLVTAGFQLCVVSYYSGVDSNGDRIPRATAVSTPITSVFVGTRVDSQRRRLPSGE